MPRRGLREEVGSMSRTRITTLVRVVCVVLTSGGLLAGCGTGGQERSLIQNFFTAARFGDRATLGNIGMVAFDPQTDGTVASFDVESVSEEQRRPLRIRDLSDALDQAQLAEQDHAVQMKAYQDENLEAISRVIEAERGNEDVGAADQEVQEGWTKWRMESQAHSRKVADAGTALGEESQIALVSVFDPSNPVDVQQYDGELLTKEVTIDATVDQEESSEQRTMVITLQKVELGSGEDMIDGRWIISAIS